MKLTVYGSGYVGLITEACLADLVRRNVATGLLKFASGVSHGLLSQFITTGTQPEEDGFADKIKIKITIRETLHKRGCKTTCVMQRTQAHLWRTRRSQIVRSPGGSIGKCRCTRDMCRAEGVPQPGFRYYKAQIKNPVIFEDCNIYDPNLLKSLGPRYFGIGRGEQP